MIAQDFIDAHGAPTAIPIHHDPFEIEEDEEQPVYQPRPQCGQCKFFYQSKNPKARFSVWGHCVAKDAERRMSDTPCRLYKEDCPF